MGFFPTGLRIKYTEEEEIAWKEYWKWWEEEQERKRIKKNDNIRTDKQSEDG